MNQGRIKVLNYLNRFYNVNEGANRNVLWPVAVFSISIPVKKEKPLNIFEETIFQLLNQKINDISQLSKEVCMKEDVIKFILNKLCEQNLIDGDNTLTEDGEKLIEQWETEESEYKSASIFYDLIGQQLLPTVIYNELKFEQIVELTKYRVRFFDSRFDRNKSISSGAFLDFRDNPSIETPTAKDITKIINFHRKLHFKYIQISEKKDLYLPNYYSKGGAIRIISKPNYYHLYCKVIFQKGSNDFIITDPFGYGFSSSLKKSFNEYLSNNKDESDMIIKMQKEAIVKEINKSEINKVATNLTMFTDRINNYPQIRKFITSAENNWKKAIIKPSNSVEEDKHKMYLDYALTSLYKSLEWTLKIVVNNYPVENWVELLENQNYKSNGLLISKLANKIGFIIPKEFSLLRVAPGKFKAFSEGSVELQPLLSLSILGASNDNLHPFNSLVTKNKDWLDMVNQLKRFRDSEQHGDTQKNKIKVKQVEYFRFQIYETIRTLLPETTVKMKVKGEVENVEDIESKEDQDREKISIFLQEEFGYNEFRLINKDIKELLMRIELFIIENKNTKEEQLDCSQAITNLSSLIQNTLFILIKQCLNKNILENFNYEVVKLQERVERYFGISKYNFPEILTHVNPHRIRSAYNGTNSTLGANLIALINLSQDSDLEELGSINPNLIEVVGDILFKRKHGNEPVFMEFKALIELKNKVYIVLKQLQEIENG